MAKDTKSDFSDLYDLFLGSLAYSRELDKDITDFLEVFIGTTVMHHNGTFYRAHSYDIDTSRFHLYAYVSEGDHNPVFKISSEKAMEVSPDFLRGGPWSAVLELEPTLVNEEFYLDTSIGSGAFDQAYDVLCEMSYNLEYSNGSLYNDLWQSKFAGRVVYTLDGYFLMMQSDTYGFTTLVPVSVCREFYSAGLAFSQDALEVPVDFVKKCSGASFKPYRANEQLQLRNTLVEDLEFCPEARLTHQVFSEDSYPEGWL